jgi:hypothetical protein
MVFEEFFTVSEVAEILKASPDTVIRRFDGRPGVIDLGSPELTHKRRYRELRISRSALERFIREKQGRIQ